MGTVEVGLHMSVKVSVHGGSKSACSGSLYIRVGQRQQKCLQWFPVLKDRTEAAEVLALGPCTHKKLLSLT